MIGFQSNPQKIDASADAAQISMLKRFPPEGLPHTWPVFLVGMMGAGKTTLGRLLARNLGREFFDLDQELETRCGVRIPIIFEIEGEIGFRKREAAALAQCTARRNIVLATGGGTILTAHNRAMLRAQGIVVYLQSNIEALYQRTCQNRRRSSRPLLAQADPWNSLHTLMQQRESLYQEVAHITLDTGSTSMRSVLKTLLSLLQSYERPL
jgi:shikimate kinase